jgi:hypothetical protein
MGDDRRSTRAGFRILLVVMAIQGLTPDHSDLASSRLLRLVISGLVDSRSPDGAPAPLPIPIPRGQEDGVPGEICATAAVHATLRVRLDVGGEPCVHPRPVGLVDRPSRSGCYLHSHPGAVVQGSAGLTLSLCRFLC